MTSKSVISSIARTPIGSFQGNLSSVSTVTLGATVIKSVIDRLDINSSLIDEVIMGNVLCASEGQAPARQASIYAGLHNSVECLTINKVCGSGLKSIMLADQSIRCGDSKIIIAGGMENMSQAPYYLIDARDGMRLGNKEITDSIIKDGLWDPYNDMHMGNCAEVLSYENNINRENQDNFAKESYRRSIQAIRNGYFKYEIVPIEITDKNKKIIIIDTDEEPNRVKLDKISNLRTVFKNDGTITAANASSISDGAAAMMVMSEGTSKDLNIVPICRILAHATIAHEPLYFTTAPSKAIAKVLKKANLKIDDIDLFEINEAFSNIVIATMKEHKIQHEKVNINGGAVSLGHPIGASGARILVTLISALKQKNKTYGLATLCIGGGEAVAMIVEML
tara:strand:+ start:1242 stop:2423 length:1182 start_codon:yes stop_codon:yes gene_type:complete